MRAILVLGCRVEPDGTPSPALARRIDAAVALWRPGDLLIGTGGPGPDHPPEGAVIAAEARRRGLPEDAVRAETASRSTWENVRLALPLAEGRPLLLVTDGFHVPRARMIARRLGQRAEARPCAPGAALRRWRGALREVPAYVKDRLRPLTPR